jgi:Uma2 family endonuclease
MTPPYQEVLHGMPLLRQAPGERHEAICARLYRALLVSTANLKSTRVLEPRSELTLSRENVLRPDLALVATATGKLWLAAEIVNSADHAPDTVAKKQIYEDIKLPRLWMIDPRYDNIEVYHGGPYGLVLQGILAGAETLTEKLLPDFRVTVAELFQAENSGEQR